MLFVWLLLLAKRCESYSKDPYEDGWSCWDEGPMVVKYTDTGNPVPAFPTFYMHLAQWDSWHVLNMAAQILLKEKMGVTFIGCGGDHPDDGKPCYEGYPVGLYDAMEENRVHANLEVWPDQIASAKIIERSQAKKLQALGVTGVAGIEVFITADYDGTWPVGSFRALKETAVINQMMTETTQLANQFKGTGGVFKRYTGTWTQSAQINLIEPDEEITATMTNSKPIIFSIGWTWGSAKWSRDLLHDQGLDVLYELWVFKTEATAIDMMTYAKANNLHYVTYIWEPSFAFGSYQKRLVVGKYPQVAGCVALGQCDRPPLSLEKVISNYVGEQLPEAAEFMKRYGFKSNMAVNGILFDKISNNKSWKAAICTWLKANEASWASFIVPIKRIENVDPWWKIWIQIGGIFCGAVFIIILGYLLWKNLRFDESEETMELAARWKKEAKLEVATQGMYVVFETSDVISTVYATYTCFDVAGDNDVLVAGFVIVLVLEVASAIFIVHQRFTLLRPAFEKIAGTFQPDQASGTRITAQMWKSATRSRYKAELLQFLAGMTEDLAAVILYIVVFALGFNETGFVVGAVMSCVGLGYKMASLEKMQIWKQKTPFYVDVSPENISSIAAEVSEEHSADKSKDD